MVECVQVRRDPRQQALAIGSEFNPARTALEQALAEPLLQRPDLVAEAADREVQRFGGAGQVADPRGGRESQQCVQRRARHGRSSEVSSLELYSRLLCKSVAF